MNNGTIRRAPGGGWIADVRVNGKRRQLAAKTKAEAKERFDQEVQRLLNGEIPVRPRSAERVQVDPSRGLTLGQARANSLNGSRWTGAYRGSALIYSRHVVEFFGEDVLLEEITAQQIKDFRVCWQNKGNRNTTVNKKVMALRAMATDAFEEGLIKRMPPFPKPLREAKNTRRALSDEEIQGLFQYFVDNGHLEMADIFMLTLDTCSRWSDIARLRGEDVDVQRRVVTFPETKNGDSRSVGLTPRALEILERYRTVHPRHLVFNLDYKVSNRIFNKAKKHLGLEWDQRFVFHSLRHTGATRMTSNGVAQTKVMRFGGWRDPRVFNRYNHLVVDDLKECSDVMGAVGSDKPSNPVF